MPLILGKGGGGGAMEGIAKKGRGSGSGEMEGTEKR